MPAALIALGASLYVPEWQAERAGQPEVAFLTAVKLAVQPLIAFLIGAFVFGLARDLLLAVVVCAGLPTAQNTFIFAQEYVEMAFEMEKFSQGDFPGQQCSSSLGSLAAIAALIGH